MSLKMIMIVYNISIQTEVLEVVQDSGATCYTCWPRLIGKGRPQGEMMTTSGSSNAAIITVVDEDTAATLMDASALRDDIGA